MIFRRKKEEPFVPYHRQPYTYKYCPVILPAEPWKALHQDVRMVPLEFLKLLLDPERTNQLRKREAQYIRELTASLLGEGIHTPLELYIDANEKIRLQEGHHRMIVFLEFPDHFPNIPVILKSSRGAIKAWGRTLCSITPEVLDLLSTQTERRVTWAAEVARWRANDD